jgi:hypothetical protein
VPHIIFLEQLEYTNGLPKLRRLIIILVLQTGVLVILEYSSHFGRSLGGAAGGSTKKLFNL